MVSDEMVSYGTYVAIKVIDTCRVYCASKLMHNKVLYSIKTTVKIGKQNITHLSTSGEQASCNYSILLA